VERQMETFHFWCKLLPRLDGAAPPAFLKSTLKKVLKLGVGFALPYFQS